MPDSEWQSLPGVYKPPAGCLLLAEVDGQSAGCVALRPFPQTDTGEMKRLYVCPEFRYRGVGRALVAALIDMARNKAYKRIRMDTHPPTMSSAISLYRQLGFHEVPADPLPPSAELMYLAIEIA